MDGDLISVIDLAAQVGRRKQTLFKVIERLRIETQKLSGSSSRGQLVAYVTSSEAKRIREELTASAAEPDNGAEGDVGDGYLPAQKGVFYLLQLEPNHDPGRFKVGFATDLSERLRKHRCSAPFATLVKSWMCRSLWEKTAIDCITAGCERLHTEVFRTASIGEVVARCDRFFGLTPGLPEEGSADEPAPLSGETSLRG